MVSVGSYVISAVALVVVGASIGFTAYRLRQRLMPAWDGAPARLVESIVAIALLIWLGELLGTFGLFYAWVFVGASVLLAVLAKTLLPVGGTVGGPTPEDALQTGRGAGPPAVTGPAGPSAFAWLVTVGVIALVFAHWGLTTKDAL